MSLPALSLEMYISHFKAISLSTHISGSKRRISDPKMGLWPAPDLKKKSTNFQYCP
jgi:hypothetical protein